MKSDGSIIIDTKILDGGMEKGFEALKNDMKSVGIVAKQVGNQISMSFVSTDVTKQIASAAERVRMLEQQLASVSSELKYAVAENDDKSAERLAEKQIKIYDRLEAARKKLAAEITSAAKKQSAAEQKAAKKAAEAEERAAKKKIAAATKSMRRFNTRLGSIVTGALVFNLISQGLRGVTEYFGKALKSSGEFSTSLANLKGALLTAFQPIYEYVLPGLIKLVDVATTAAQAIGHIFANLTGKSYTQMAKNAQALYEQANATEKVGQEAKKAQKYLAGFDEIQKISSANNDAAYSQDSNAAEPDFSKFANEDYQSMLEGTIALTSMALIALGTILAFSGINIPLGITMIGIGAAGLYQEVSTNWAAVQKELEGSTGEIVAIVSGALLAIGAILAFSGANIPLGIGLMAVGAVGLGTYAAANWSTIKEKLQGPIGKITSLMSGALLAIGGVLAFSGVNIPLGIGLMAAGAVGLGATVAANWSTIKEKLQGPIGSVVAVVSGALLAIGAVLAFSGVALPLGIGLMAAGAVGLGTYAAANWSSIKEKLQGPIGDIVSIVSGALLAIGVILAVSGVALPIGLALIAAGAIGLATTMAANWNTMPNKIETIITSVLWILSGASLVLGVILCLTGAGLGLGLALIFAGLAGTTAAWKVEDNPITKFVKKMANGIINVINIVIEAINDMFDISFDGLKIGGVEIIPKFNAKLINIPKIPMLAEGAVLPANRPFLSVVGDQRHGTNIEAPLSTIQEAVESVMASKFADMMDGFGETVSVLREILEAVYGIHIGDDVIAQAAERYTRKMNTARGGAF